MAWPDWEESKKMESGVWELEPEGEKEVPEIIIVSDAVEGIPVDLNGESCHEQVEAKLSRRQRNTGLCERRKGYGAGRGGREDLRTERGERSAKAPVSL